MFPAPINIAPEPYFSAVLYMLYEVALFMRNYANTISPEQLSDLGDAIHNVPESLAHYGRHLDEDTIRRVYLAPYDRKWSKLPEDFSLIRALDAGAARK